MRLINSKTHKLEEFTGEIPPYVILSHTWGENEISFQEMPNFVRLKQEIDPRQRAAYTKIEGSCKTALKDGFEYVWVDTCCIDKTSSSELSEAINSMYQWYQQADVCYVYLWDIVDPGFNSETFLKSKWFTRGWTLQELIAPSNLIFFNQAWKDIGTKFSLHEYISQRTCIPSSLLLDLAISESFSIAQRMSWASDRETKRVEDVAYCLMGIFDINMPMLYGEGDRAFIRLQEEIIRSSPDQSIFAWESGSWEDQRGGLLASSPAAFSKSGDIIRSDIQSDIGFSLTSHGLSVKVPMARASSGEIIDPEIEVNYTFTAVLNCQRSYGNSCVLGILLGKNPLSPHFFRLYNVSLEEVEKSEVDSSQNNISNVYVRELWRPRGGPSYQNLQLNLSGFNEKGFSEKERYLSDNNTSGSSLDRFEDITHTAAVRFTDSDGREFVVLLELKGNPQHIKVIGPVRKSRTLEEVIRLSRIERPWKTPVDRTMWEHSGREWRIHATVKRKIVWKERCLVANISCEDSREALR
ncbi:heterokaryon incompatibility protein-domain-containing protein [Hyaloscypha sp. PMI_1271]|nr:heterokaryon incompatibility protein-domain-containing protein [Hyaloscypha sp. PMI_1271]